MRTASKQEPHRLSHASALGLRARGNGFFIVSQAVSLQESQAMWFYSWIKKS